MSRSRPLPLFAPEALEPRIAPASMTFTSSTDETKQVTVTVSKGSLADLTTALAAEATEGMFYSGGAFHFALDLHTNTKFRGAKVSVTTTGGAVTVLEKLDATGFDLQAVMVQGALEQILAGDTKLSTPALQTLRVDSLGTGEHLASTLHGSLTTLEVTGDVAGSLKLESSLGSIGTVEIGGKLVGSTTDFSGSIVTGGGIRSLTITGGLQGGDNDSSGSVFAHGPIKSATLGSLVGGLGKFSANLSSDASITRVTITGSIVGNTDEESGIQNAQVFASRSLSHITVDGTVSGGAADNSGEIVSSGKISFATLKGGLFGGSGKQSGSLGSGGLVQSITVGVPGAAVPTDILVGGANTQSGAILSTSKILDVEIWGNIVGGSFAQSGIVASDGLLSNVVVHGSVKGGAGVGSGAIGSTKALGDVVVEGDLQGNAPSSGQIVSSTSINSVIIRGSIIGGGGQESGSIGALGTIGLVQVDHNVSGGGGFHSGSILAGTTLKAIDIGQSLLGLVGAGSEGGDAQIVADALGKVTIGGSIVGGDNGESAWIQGRSIDSVTVTGSIQGGKGDESARVISIQGKIGTVKVGVDLIGGGGKQSGSIFGGSIGQVDVTGAIRGSANFAGSVISIAGDIGSVHAGSISSTVSTSGTTGGSAYISAFRNLGSVTAGSILGQSSAPVYLMAGGNLKAAKLADTVAIQSITTTGRMLFTDVLAGYRAEFGEGGQDLVTDGVNGHTSIGTVEVGTSKALDAPWQANNIVAGASSIGVSNGVINGGNTKFHSVIAKVIVHGNLAAAQSFFGVVTAEEVRSMTVGSTNTAVDLTAGPNNDLTYSPAANDPDFSTYIYEIGAGS